MNFAASLGNWLNECGIVQEWHGWGDFHFEHLLQIAVAGVLIFFAIHISRLLKAQEDNTTDSNI